VKDYLLRALWSAWASIMLGMALHVSGIKGSAQFGCALYSVLMATWYRNREKP
jgi:hypothetical protein